MRAAARYAYFHTRVSLLAARLLSEEQLAALVDASEEERRELLKNTGFMRIIGDTSDNSDELEQGLVLALLQDLRVLTRALAGPARDFFIYWAHRYELTNFKAILRGKMAGLTPSTLQKQLVDMEPYATLPVDELLGAEDMAELLRRLENTADYALIARHARQVFEERRELFAVDAAVDRHYYAGLSQRVRRLPGTDRRYLEPLVGSLIDRINLVWLLRYRFVYQLPPAEAYYLLIPANYRLSSRQVLRLAELDSFEEVLRRLPEPFRGLLEGASTISEATEILRYWHWRLADKVLKRSVFNLGRGFAYLLLRDRDLRHLRALMKGRRLSLHPRLIQVAVGLEAGHGLLK